MVFRRMDDFARLGAAEYNAAVGLIECHAMHWTPSVGSDSVPAAGEKQT